MKLRGTQLTFGSRFAPAGRLEVAPPIVEPGSRLRVAGFFAGVGGLERGLAESGHHAVMLCEFDPGARAVLADRFPHVPLEGDVRDVVELPQCDLVAAGFPCQDLSQAGGTAGIAGKRSGLIQVVFELIRRSRHPPEWLLLENVPFMLQLERGRAMSYLVDRLESLGYRWAYRVIDSRSFGLPQRRRRVLVLASRNLDPRSALFADDEGPDDMEMGSARYFGFYWTEGIRGLGWAVESIPTLKGGSTVGIPSPPAVWDSRTGLVGTPSLRDAERLQGFPANWTEPASSVKGLRNSFRWKLVGNAVNVRLSEWIGRRLVETSNYDDSGDFPLGPDEPWPNAAWGSDGVARRAHVGEWVRSRRKKLLLSEFLEDELKPLSVRAANGFLQRTARGCLRFPAGFLEAVRKHADRVARAPAIARPTRRAVGS